MVELARAELADRHAVARQLRVGDYTIEMPSTSGFIVSPQTKGQRKRTDDDGAAAHNALKGVRAERNILPRSRRTNGQGNFSGESSPKPCCEKRRRRTRMRRRSIVSAWFLQQPCSQSMRLRLMVQCVLYSYHTEGKEGKG